MCFTKCPYNKEMNSMELTLLDADHVSAFHKLEVTDLFYVHGKKIVEKEITDKEGKTFTVLCVE